MSKYGALSRAQRRIRQLGASSLSSTRLAITTHRTDRDDALLSSTPDPRFRKKSGSARTGSLGALNSGYTRFDKPTWQLLHSPIAIQQLRLLEWRKRLDTHPCQCFHSRSPPPRRGTESWHRLCDSCENWELDVVLHRCSPGNRRTLLRTACKRNLSLVSC